MQGKPERRRTQDRHAIFSHVQLRHAAGRDSGNQVVPGFLRVQYCLFGSGRAYENSQASVGTPLLLEAPGGDSVTGVRTWLHGNAGAAKGDGGQDLPAGSEVPCPRTL